MSFNINRRAFLKSSIATTILASVGDYGLHLLYPSQPWRVGLIGTGWYGKNDLFRLMQVTNTEVVALCDVDNHLLHEASDMIVKRNQQKKAPKLFRDYRKMLKDVELDLVLIGTPDHWHALQAIECLKAGCHVYLQKPISVDVIEGEAILAAAKKYSKTVQIGTQRRSTPHLIEAKTNIIDKGLLGKIGHVEMCCYYHMRFNKNPDIQPVPSYFDYELWSGPAPILPYRGLPHRGFWRSRMEYGNGIVGDMCVHMLDTVRWMLELGWPKRISSQGGILVQNHGISNISDTQTALFEYEHFNCLWTHRSWGTSPDPDYPWAFIIYGELGTLKGSVMKYEFTSIDGKTHIRGDVQYEKEKYPDDLVEKDIELHTAPATRHHMLNFIDAIENKKKPVADIENGHISSSSCIIANLAMKLERPLVYNHLKRTFENDQEANSMLARKYENGWSHPLPEDF